MKYFGLIALICTFQSIDVSVACWEHELGVTGYENGLDNIIKFENGAHFELTSDCRMFGSVNATLTRKIRTGLVSYKIKTVYGDLVTKKNLDICELISEFGIGGIGCPPLPGRHLVKMGGDINYSSYGSFLEFFVGDVTALIKICYDGNENNPDVFALRGIIKKKNRA